VVAAVSLQWSVTRDYRREVWHRERAKMCIDSPSQYWTSGCRRWAFRERSFDPVSAANAQATEGRWTIAQGRAEVVATSLEQARLALTIRAITPIQLVINSPFVPGWTLSLDDRAVDVMVRPGSGFMELGVPAGTHRIDAAFRRTRIRLVADVLTGASFIVWALIAFKTVLRARLPTRFSDISLA